jgi:alkylhydroperoxidase family enzyme
MSHLTADPLPENVYTPEEAAIIRYAQKSTRLEPIDDATYGALEQHFSQQQIIDICLTVGLSNMINRFHATFQTDVDEDTLNEVADRTPDGMSCPIRLPKRPGT